MSGLDKAEQLLLADELPCPHCQAVLRPFGHGRPRVVHGLGSARLRITPRRARCSAHGAGVRTVLGGAAQRNRERLHAVVVTGRRLRRGATGPAHPDASPNLISGSDRVSGCRILPST